MTKPYECSNKFAALANQIREIENAVYNWTRIATYRRDGRSSPIESLYARNALGTAATELEAIAKEWRCAGI